MLLPIILPTAVERCLKKQHKNIFTADKLHNEMKSFKTFINTLFPDSKVFNIVSSIRKDGFDAIAAYIKLLKVIEPMPR